jgi:hypothetical protein
VVVSSVSAASPCCAKAFSMGLKMIVAVMSQAVEQRRDDLGVVEDRLPPGMFGSPILSLTLARDHSILFNRSAKL